MTGAQRIPAPPPETKSSAPVKGLAPEAANPVAPGPDESAPNPAEANRRADAPESGEAGAGREESRQAEGSSSPPDTGPNRDADADARPPPEAETTGRSEPPTLVIRYGRMGMLGRFTYSLERWRRGQRAVIKSDRGIEIGTIVCRWVPDGGGDGDLKVTGEVLRLVTHSDEVDERHLEQDAQREFDFCRKRIADRGLPMKLVGVEHLFGGDRIIFYFVAEKRVDFRALVRDLAREFQTRIEMRQIGVRDEARLLGDYERCGRPLCCRAFIKDLEPVSMKMAKIQKATLDPSKISGRCGRLMCCLRFEHATYKELRKNLPRKNREVGTAVGPGHVVGSDVVTQMVHVQLTTGTRVTVPVESLVPPEEAPPPGTVAPVAAGTGRRGRASPAGEADKTKADDAEKTGNEGKDAGRKKASDQKATRKRRRRSKGKDRGRRGKSKGSSAKRTSGGGKGKSNH